MNYIPASRGQLLWGLLPLPLRCHPLSTLCFEVALPLATTPYGLTTNSPFLNPHWGSWGCTTYLPCLHRPDTASSRRLSPSLHQQSAFLLPWRLPHPCASMGRSLKQLCSRFSCWKQGKWPAASGFPSSQSPCSPFPSHVTPKKDLDLLLCHLNSLFLSCLLDPPQVFLGESLVLQIRDLHTTALGRPNPPGYIIVFIV